MSVVLTPDVVGRELVALDFGVRPTPLGFELGPTALGRAARLERGSGIAGRGNTWRIVSVRGSRVLSGSLRTRAQLLQAVTEYLAGPRPSPPTDCTRPRVVRLDDETLRRRFERYGVPASPFVWRWRLRRRRPSRVVHYGYVDHRSP